MNIVKIALSALEKASCNVRVTAADVGVNELAASIKAHGLLQPLIVIPPGPQREYQVVDGARRLAALRKVHGRKDVDVPVVYAGSRDEAQLREASLAANVMRVALHPVDEFEAFGQLKTEGLAEAAIAERFGITSIEVKKRLRLGDLAREVRDAWRAGKIDDRQAMAFAASSDAAAQATVLKSVLKAKADYDRSAHCIRAELTRSMVRPDDPRLTFIGGVEAYTAAGGAVQEDLFEGVTRLKDGALVKRLVEQKLEAECRRLVAEDGWSWAIHSGEADDWYNWPSPILQDHATTEEKKALAGKAWDARSKAERAIKERLLSDPAFRATAGVVIELGYAGQVNTRGVFLSRQAEESDASDIGDEHGDEAGHHQDEEPAVDEPAIDGAAEPQAPHPTRLALSEGMTAALAAVMKDRPYVALAALTATLRLRLTSYGASPLRIDPDHRRPGGGSSSREDGTSWHDAFAEIERGPVDNLVGELAAHVATLLDLRDLKFDDRAAHRFWDRQACTQAIANALPGDAVTAAIAQRFDADAYFAKIPTALIDATVTEMTGRPGQGSKKAEKAAFAAGVAKCLRWLPPELRTAHYTGPGSAAWETAKAQREAAE